MAHTVFGIDLGTTFSAIAYVNEYGQPEVILNRENTAVTPSVVYFETLSNVLVGLAARESGRIDPVNYVELIKRKMGDKEHRNYIHGKEFRPEEISARILMKLKEDAEIALGKTVTDVVITVPAYFDESQRTATMQAGQIAGLNVIAVIPEPTAAAIAYAATDKDRQTILVYDLGGGTFDVTVIKIDGPKVEVLGIDGDHELGGRNWDEDVVNFLAHAWKEKTNSDDDPRNDPESNLELFKQAEEAKRNLTNMGRAPIKVMHNGQSARVDLHREKFDELTSSRLERTIALTHQVLAATNSAGKIDKILLVGGSTYMPQVKERLAKEFPGLELQQFDPDKAIALGAAIYATNKDLQSRMRDAIEKVFGKEKAAQVAERGIEALSATEQAAVRKQVKLQLPGISDSFLDSASAMTIVNACSKNFGVAALNENGDLRITYMIRRNMPVPAAHEDTFYTPMPDMTLIYVKVFETDGIQPSDDPTHPSCRLMVEYPLSLPRGIPMNHPIEVRFSLSEDGGRLRIQATERQYGMSLDEIVQTTGALMPQEIDAMRDEMRGTKINR